MAESTQEAVCCEPFDAARWQEREWSWHGKLFARDHVRSVFHIPLNFGAVMTRNMGKIHTEHAETPDHLVLADETGLFRTDLLFEVSKDLPGSEMVRLTGDYVAQAYEGPYNEIPNFVKATQKLVADRGKSLEHLYFYYPLCPKCAEKFGKNYVVVVAQT